MYTYTPMLKHSTYYNNVLRLFKFIFSEWKGRRYFENVTHFPSHLGTLRVTKYEKCAECDVCFNWHFIFNVRESARAQYVL